MEAEGRRRTGIIPGVMIQQFDRERERRKEKGEGEREQGRGAEREEGRKGGRMEEWRLSRSRRKRKIA